LLRYRENTAYYPTPYKHKIPIPDLNVFTDDHVLFKVWNKNYFMYRYIITNGSQNRNKTNDIKNITFLRLYEFYYRRIVKW